MNNYKDCKVIYKLKKKKDYNERLQNSKKELEFINPERIIPFSSENGQGVDIVKNYIEQYIGEEDNE